MNVKYLFFLIFILFSGAISFSQALSRKEFLKQIKSDKVPNFVINGSLYRPADSLLLDKELSTMVVNKITALTVLKDTGNLAYAYVPTIFIEYATELSRKDIDTRIKEIKKNLKASKSNPELYLNGTKVPLTFHQIFANRLTKDDISYIYFNNPNTNDTTNLFKGSIHIWTKDKFYK